MTLATHITLMCLLFTTAPSPFTLHNDLVSILLAMPSWVNLVAQFCNIAQHCMAKGSTKCMADGASTWRQRVGSSGVLLYSQQGIWLIMYFVFTRIFQLRTNSTHERPVGPEPVVLGNHFFIVYYTMFSQWRVQTMRPVNYEFAKYEGGLYL